MPLLLLTAQPLRRAGLGADMGEARRRGTLEERKSLAEAAAEQYRRKHDELRMERLAGSAGMTG